MGKPKGSGMHVIPVLLAAMLCSVCLSGCGASLEVREQMSRPVAEVSAAEAPFPAAHDLAILAIDFSPPLDCKELWAEQEQVTLLIAVENRGLWQEKEVRVHATLSDCHNPEILLRQSVTLPVLAPGQVEVVRIAGISNVPHRPAYRLHVDVSPAEGERAVADNARTYELTINQSVQEPVSDFTSPLVER